MTPPTDTWCGAVLELLRQGLPNTFQHDPGRRGRCCRVRYDRVALSVDEPAGVPIALRGGLRLECLALEGCMEYRGAARRAMGTRFLARPDCESKPRVCPARLVNGRAFASACVSVMAIIVVSVFPAAVMRPSAAVPPILSAGKLLWAPCTGRQGVRLPIRRASSSQGSCVKGWYGICPRPDPGWLGLR